MNDWIDNLKIGDLVQKGDVWYSFMGQDENGYYSLYSIPYKLSRYEMEQWCKPAEVEELK